MTDTPPPPAAQTTARPPVDRAALRADVLAGITTAVMLVPQAMAYAVLAGLEPIVGLYAATVPLMVYAFAGSVPQLSVGPVALESLMVAAGLGALAFDDPTAYAAAAAMLAVMVGAIQLTAGSIGLGVIARLVSRPVIAGFTSAAAVVIAATQLGTALGVPLPRDTFVNTLAALPHAVPSTHLPTLVVTTSALAALFAMKRWAPRLPRYLIVVAAGTLAVSLGGLGEAGLRIVGDVPPGLPHLAWPDVSPGRWAELLPLALTIALVGFMEAISVGSVYTRRAGRTLDPDRELRALGLANTSAGLTGAYPITGGLSRTAVHANAGATTRTASLVTAGVVMVTLLWLTPWFHDLPKAVLAAVILSAVVGLVDLTEARRLWTVSRTDFAAMATTFGATLLLGVQLGLLVGVVASLAAFLRSLTAPHTAVLGHIPGTELYMKLERNPEACTEAGVLAVRIDAPLFFANADALRETLTNMECRCNSPLETVVLDAAGMGHIDATGAATLREVLTAYQARGIHFVIASARGPIRDLLARSGYTELAGPEGFARSVYEALERRRVARPEAADSEARADAPAEGA